MTIHKELEDQRLCIDHQYAPAIFEYVLLSSPYRLMRRSDAISDLLSETLVIVNARIMTIQELNE